MINALKWLVNFLETRFPEKVTPVSKEDFQALLTTTQALHATIEAVQTQLDEQKKHIEVLNLRVGLSRPIPYGLKEKHHG